MSEISFLTSPLHELRSWQLTFALVAGMLLAAEVGFRVGRRRYEKVGDPGRGHFTAVQAALLALLALLLGFTFNMANLRFDARRQGVLDSANNFAALRLRSAELPEPQRAEFQNLLSDCLAAQAIESPQVKARITAADLGARAARIQELHRRMWEILRLTAQTPNPPRVLETLAGQLTEAQALVRRRIYAYLNRVPDAILTLLFAAALGAASVVGCSAGLSQDRGRLQTIALTFFVCGTIHVILDLDRPLTGMQVDQSPLLNLQSQWQHESKLR